MRDPADLICDALAARFAGDLDRSIMGATCTTSAASTGPELTIDSLLASMRRLEALQPCQEPQPYQRGMIELLGDPKPLALGSVIGGVRVIESPFAERIVPRRVHVKRRHQTEAYHRRVQKKWTKRFGTVAEPVAYMVDGAAFGLQLWPGHPPQPVAVLHPRHVVALRGLTMGAHNARDRLPTTLPKGDPT